MGIKISKNTPMNTLRLDDYEYVRPKRLSNQIFDYKILKNRLTGNEMQEYILQFGDSTQYQDYYDAYYWRLSQDHVVRTLHFIDLTQAQFCSTVYAAKLYTERIPLKLSDIKDIPYPDNLYVLLASLDGFDRIVQKAGFFEIQQHMICINRQGEVKVWINDNLSRNYPDNGRTGINSEQQMVKRLIAIIESNTDKTSQPSSLSNYIYSQVHNPSFGDAMLLVRQYSKQHRIQIPTNFQCILQVLNDSKYPSQHSQSQQSISQYSNIRSSIPQFGNGSSLHPNYQTGLVTAQINPRISQFSRISHQIPSNPINMLHRSVYQNHSLPRRQIRQISKSPQPIAAASFISPRLMTIQQPIQRFPQNIQARGIVTQKTLSPKKVINRQQSIVHQRYINKPLSHQNQVPQINIRHQNRLPTPTDVRQITKINPSILKNKQSQQLRNNEHIHQTRHQNILVQNKQQEVRNKPQRKQQDSNQIFDRTLSPPNRDLTSQFVNPFYQQQEQQQSPGFAKPFYELPINTRQSNILKLQTAEDERNQKMIEQIKRNKVQIFKQTKQIVNKIRQSHKEQQQSKEYYNQNSSQQYQSKHSNKQTIQNSKYNQQPQYNRQYTQNNKNLLMSFEREQRVNNQRVERTDILVYHSLTDSHCIDPEIARDLLALVQ